MRVKKLFLRAFTLVELLVVIGIILILASLLFPAFSKIQDNANATKCASNLRQIGIAMFSFAGDNGGLFPCSGNTISYTGTDGTTKQGPWTKQLEKYLGTSYLVNNPTKTSVFTCPTTSILYPNMKYFSYFNGAHAAYFDYSQAQPTTTMVFAPLRQALIQFPSKHILAGDIASNAFPGSPPTGDADKDDFSSSGGGPAFTGNVAKMHGGKSNILFADGHVAAFSTFDYSKPVGTAKTDSDSRSLTVWYDRIADYDLNQ